MSFFLLFYIIIDRKDVILIKKDRKQIRLKRKQKELLKEFYLMPMISREYSRKQREEIKRKEKEVFEKCKKLELERK